MERFVKISELEELLKDKRAKAKFGKAIEKATVYSAEKRWTCYILGKCERYVIAEEPKSRKLYKIKKQEV
ncbi:MAG: hypothetical protein ABIB71_04085 [Candidatus Woesearchaeota archaeon]